MVPLSGFRTRYRARMGRRSRARKARNSGGSGTPTGRTTPTGEPRRGDPGPLHGENVSGLPPGGSLPGNLPAAIGQVRALLRRSRDPLEVLAAVADLRELVEYWERSAVLAARRKGRSWRAISEALDVPRATLHDRYGDVAPTAARPSSRSGERPARRPARGAPREPRE